MFYLYNQKSIYMNMKSQFFTGINLSKSHDDTWG